MRICITSQGDSLESKVEPRFGRSPYFIIYNTVLSDFEVIENPNISAASGVGIKSAQLIADKKVTAVLTGKVGPKATTPLKAAGITIIDSTSGTVRETIDNYLSSDFKNDPIEKQDNQSEFTDTSQEQALQKGGWFRGCFKRWFKSESSGNTNFRQGRSLGNGQGKNIRGFGMPPDYCVCPKCGQKIKHVPGTPCRSNTCEKCGTTMVRE